MNGAQICWYCYWGWAEPVAELYERYSAEVGELLTNGPAHCVWGDENFGTDAILWCLDNWEHNAATILEDCDAYFLDELRKELERVRQSLLELLAIPEEVRACQPANYDGAVPANYPPAVRTRKPEEGA